VKFGNNHPNFEIDQEKARTHIVSIAVKVGEAQLKSRGPFHTEFFFGYFKIALQTLFFFSRDRIESSDEMPTFHS
jgi:hypothetical protein